MSTHTVDMPEVTDAHRRAAFEAMHWADWTFEAAMADDMRRRLVEARAHQLRTSACRARTVVPTPSLPQSRPVCPVRAVVQTPALFRPLPAGIVDRKRAAAGDRDDD